MGVIAICSALFASIWLKTEIGDIPTVSDMNLLLCTQLPIILFANLYPYVFLAKHRRIRRAVRLQHRRFSHFLTAVGLLPEKSRQMRAGLAEGEDVAAAKSSMTNTVIVSHHVNPQSAQRMLENIWETGQKRKERRRSSSLL